MRALSEIVVIVAGTLTIFGFSYHAYLTIKKRKDNST